MQRVAMGEVEDAEGSRRAVRCETVVDAIYVDKDANPQLHIGNAIHNRQIRAFRGIDMSRATNVVYQAAFTPSVTHEEISDADSAAIALDLVVGFEASTRVLSFSGNAQRVVADAGQKMFANICATPAVREAWAAAKVGSCHVASAGRSVSKGMHLLLLLRGLSVGVKNQSEKYVPYMALERKLLDEYGDREDFLDKLHKKDHENGMKMLSSSSVGGCLCCFSVFATRCNLICKTNGEYYKPLQRLLMQNKTSPAMLIWVVMGGRMCTRCINSVSTDFAKGGMGELMLKMMRLSKEEQDVFLWLIDEKIVHGGSGVSSIGDWHVLRNFLTALFTMQTPALKVSVPRKAKAVRVKKEYELEESDDSDAAAAGPALHSVGEDILAAIEVDHMFDATDLDDFRKD